MIKINKIIQLSFFLLLVISFYSCDDEINRQEDCNLKTTFVDSTNIIPYNDDFLINFSLHGQKYPQGFYKEETNNIASIYYVNTVSTKLDITKWIQLCTNDSSEAISWMKLSSENELTEFKDTEKYFQATSNSTTSSYKILFRVHKCSYLDRTNYNFLIKTDTIGIFNIRPTNEQTVKEVIQYLWFIENYNISNPKILYAIYSEELEKCLYSIYVVNYIAGDFGMCPTITVEKQNYSVNKFTGIITKNSKIIRTISD